MTKENEDNLCQNDDLKVLTDHFEKNPETEKILATGIKWSIIILSVCIGISGGIILGLYGIQEVTKIINKL